VGKLKNSQGIECPYPKFPQAAWRVRRREGRERVGAAGEGSLAEDAGFFWSFQADFTNEMGI